MARVAALLLALLCPDLAAAQMLPGGAGYRVRFFEPWTDFPGDDDTAAARYMNAWIEERIRENPAQYLWVHRRFKTRPEGEARPYRGR